MGNSNRDDPANTMVSSGVTNHNKSGYWFTAIKYTHIFSPSVLNRVGVGCPFFVPLWAEKFNLQQPPWPGPIKRVTKISASDPDVTSRDMKYAYNLQWNFRAKVYLTRG